MKATFSPVNQRCTLPLPRLVPMCTRVRPITSALAQGRGVSAVNTEDR